jgi:hypothetical protein
MSQRRRLESPPSSELQAPYTQRTPPFDCGDEFESTDTEEPGRTHISQEEADECFARELQQCLDRNETEIEEFIPAPHSNKEKASQRHHTKKRTTTSMQDDGEEESDKDEADDEGSLDVAELCALDYSVCLDISGLLVHSPLIPEATQTPLHLCPNR